MDAWRVRKANKVNICALNTTTMVCCRMIYWFVVYFFFLFNSFLPLFAFSDVAGFYLGDVANVVMLFVQDVDAFFCLSILISRRDSLIEINFIPKNDFV